jgi:hypothetical protein
MAKQQFAIRPPFRENRRQVQLLKGNFTVFLANRTKIDLPNRQDTPLPAANRCDSSSPIGRNHVLTRYA